MEIRELVAKSNVGEITAFIGDIKIDKSKDMEITVINNLQKHGSNEKIMKAIQVVDLSNNILNKQYKSLSVAETNKLLVAEALLNNEETLIFDNVNKCLTYREIENIKRILKKLADHNKRVIIISNDIELLFNLTKKVYAVKNGIILKEFYPVDWYDNEIYEYVSKSPIIDFVMNLKKKNIKIEDSIETKELLKAIYRSVGKWDTY